MSYPKTKEEWWQMLDENWPDLLDILYRWIGMDDRENVDGKITNEARAVEIERMRKEHNPAIVRYLSAAWCNAPDVMGLHSIPGWNMLCDLCSEEYLLHDEREPEQEEQEVSAF
jgi:hypothetical protein